MVETVGIRTAPTRRASAESGNTSTGAGGTFVSWCDSSRRVLNSKTPTNTNRAKPKNRKIPCMGLVGLTMKLFDKYSAPHNVPKKVANKLPE